MSESEKGRAGGEAAAVSAGMCVFALFVHSGLPLVLVSAAGLALAAVAVHLSFDGGTPRLAVVGFAPAPSPHPAAPRPVWLLAALTAFGLAAGTVFGVVTRWTSGRPPFPDALRAFAPLAVLIGAAEEVLYRGYVQGRLRPLGGFPAVVAAAACHTAYKCALFTFPPAHVTVDFVSLASTTFVAGLVLGAMRELARNVTPALAAHACFDVVVYGALAEAPWWVWGGWS